MSKYIDADHLKEDIQANLAAISFNDDYQRGYEACGMSVLKSIESLQQEQLPGIEENGVPGKDFIPVDWVDACEKYGKWKIVQQGQPDVDLQKAARHVYESWMGGTMDDVRRDMVELGKVLDARKEGQK